MAIDPTSGAPQAIPPFHRDDSYTSASAQRLNGALERGDWGEVRRQIGDLDRRIATDGVGSIDRTEAIEWMSELGQVHASAADEDHVSELTYGLTGVFSFGLIPLLMAIFDAIINADHELALSEAGTLSWMLREDVDEHLTWEAPQLNEAELAAGAMPPPPRNWPTGFKSTNITQAPQPAVTHRAIEHLTRFATTMAADGGLDARDLNLLAMRLNSSVTLLSHDLDAAQTFLDEVLPNLINTNLPDVRDESFDTARRRLDDVIGAAKGEISAELELRRLHGDASMVEGEPEP